MNGGVRGCLGIGLEAVKMTSHPEVKLVSQRFAESLELHADQIAGALVEHTFAEHPERAERDPVGGRARCLRDAHYHVKYLVQAGHADRPVFFANYVEWAHTTLVARNVPAADLREDLERLNRILVERLPVAESAWATQVVRASLTRLEVSAEPKPCIDPEQPLADLASRYLEYLLQGDRQGASRAILAAVEGGQPVRDIYLQVFQRAQQEIGRLWQLNRVSVAQEHYCSAATQLIMSQLYSRIFNTERVGRTLVATSVGGDLHEIGIRMVSDFFEMEGWDTFYLGANSPTSAVLETVQQRRPDLVAISATMPYHLRDVAALVEALRSLPQAPPVVVGGQAFVGAEGLWREMGAQGTAGDAQEAIQVANGLLGL